MRALSFSLCWGFVACGGTSPASEVAPPSEAEIPPAPPAIETAPQADAPPRFEKLAALDWRPASLFRAPISKTLASSELGRVRVEGASLAPQAWLALDHHTPRALSKNKKSWALTDLLNEDEEIAPGEHHLISVARAGDSFTYELQSFQVDTQARELVPPACFLFSPRGTFNGDAEADALQVIVFPLGESVTRIRVHLRGADWSSEIESEPGIPLRAIRLPSGDFSVHVSCRATSGEELASFERIITVNRDAPVKEPTP